MLSQHSRDAKYTIGEIILPLYQGRWNTVEMKSSAPVPSNDIPVGHHFHTTKVQPFTYNTLGCRIFTSQPRPTLLYKIWPPAEVFPKASYGTARIAAPDD